MSKLKLAGSAALLATALLGAGASWAHHAFSAEFDAKQPLVLKGVVTKTKWVNPHSWIYLDVTDKEGKVTNWGFEFGSVSALARVGLTKAVVPPGTEITIKGYRSRNGGPFGYTVYASIDGKDYRLGSPQEGAPPEPGATASTN